VETCYQSPPTQYSPKIPTESGRRGEISGRDWVVGGRVTISGENWAGVKLMPTDSEKLVNDQLLRGFASSGSREIEVDLSHFNDNLLPTKAEENDVATS